MDEKQLEAVRRAKARFSKSVPKGVEVVGVGIGVSGSAPALKVNLRDAPKDKNSLPKTMASRSSTISSARLHLADAAAGSRTRP
jgi:hypothetical protein